MGVADVADDRPEGVQPAEDLPAGQRDHDRRQALRSQPRSARSTSQSKLNWHSAGAATRAQAAAPAAARTSCAS